MGLREELQRKIDKKEAEILEMERQHELDMASARAYIQALTEAIKALPRDPHSDKFKPDQILRAGGAMAKTRELILAAKKPLHISEILKGLGKQQDKKNRASVTGALGIYARKREVFVRTGPNTFGLLELGHAPTASDADEPPPGFGIAPVADDDDELDAVVRH